ncbi:hypothetical protein ACJJTC_019224 [Scirpophaga incertulas]
MRALAVTTPLAAKILRPITEYQRRARPQTRKMSRAKKMIEAACSRSHQNDMIFFTKKSIESPITSVTKECMASSGPAATSQASPRHDNSSTLIDTYISDDSDYNNKQLVPYSEHSDSNNEEEPRQ